MVLGRCCSLLRQPLANSPFAPWETETTAKTKDVAARIWLAGHRKSADVSQEAASKKSELISSVRRAAAPRSREGRPREETAPTQKRACRLASKKRKEAKDGTPINGERDRRRPSRAPARRGRRAP